MGSTVSARTRLQALYFGESEQARRFRYGVILFDIITLATFIITAAVPGQWWIIPLDLLLAVALSLEFAARLYAEPDRRAHLLTFATLTDLVVIISLLLVAFTDNYAFLRVIRSLRVLRSYHVLRDLRSTSAWFRTYEDIIQRTVNLGVFIFIVTSAVYVTQNDINPGIKTYIDALYFTITTLTTTGFGDITLLGPAGRLLAVVIMVAGVSLFLRLLQVIFRPNKVRFECEDCGLLVHDADAVHCKHCGRVLHIQTEGIG
jgi:voltage-gated potassium channel